MHNSETFFKSLVGQVGKNIVETRGGKNEPAGFRLTLALFGILIFIGREVILICFRKTLRRGELNLIRIILCFFIFLGLGILFYSFHKTDSKFLQWSGNSVSYKVTGVLYVLFAVFILLKGSIDFNKSKSSYTSTISSSSYLYKLLSKDGWKLPAIQNFAEPFIFLLLGGVYSIYNFVGFMPFIISSVSYWIHLLFQITFLSIPLDEKAANMNKKYNPQDRYYDAS